MIEVKNLSKNYGDVLALQNVSISFGENKIYGLLGRNGAGKTTLLRLIAGRIFADGGTVTMDGKLIAENDAALKQLYFQSEDMLYPEKMSVKNALKMTAWFYPNFDIDYARSLAQRFSLNLNKRVKTLSTGYASIFKLMIALSVNTTYLFFDEPVLGLDANHRDLFYRILMEKYAEKPCTIVISTHLIEEVSGIVEDVIIIKDGAIIKNESRDTLLANGYTVSGAASAVDGFIAGKEVIGIDVLGGLKSAYIIGKPEGVPKGLEISPLDLQKLFIQLTNS